MEGGKAPTHQGDSKQGSDPTQTNWTWSVCACEVEELREVTMISPAGGGAGRRCDKDGRKGDAGDAEKEKKEEYLKESLVWEKMSC